MLLKVSGQSQKNKEEGDAILTNRETPTSSDTQDNKSTTHTVEATVHKNIENND